ncbi:hypothetical protein RJ641_014283 [Dillenia turbinata]|uniref:Uncharacterized protein n=1 Tax=Dillenia turbinata TaxID=194707 RepID=A0AAN8URG5_9MAGN
MHGMYSAMVQLQISSTKDNKGIEGKDHFESPPFRHLMQMTAPEWTSPFIGCSGPVCNGLVHPLQYLCMGALLSVYFI